MSPASAAAAPRSRAPLVAAGLAVLCVTLGACGSCGAGPSASATTTSGGTGGSGGGGEGESACVAFCATEAAVGCPNSNEAGCLATCESGKTAVSWCAPVVADAVECLALEPPLSFQCDIFGNAASKPGVCAAELAAIQRCWATGPYTGLPDLSKACADSCAKQAALPCADPRCAINCVGALKPGPKCNGAFAALVVCSAKQEKAGFFCDGISPIPSLPLGVCAFEQGLLRTCLQQP